MSRWQRYWFADGGRWAVAVVRIAIATSVLLTLARIWTLDPLVAPAALYRPVGPWMLLGRTPPPDALIALLWIAAWGGTVAMLVGFGTRAATAVSFGAAVALAAVSFSGSATWSHQYNVVFLAQCAFLGARGGDVLSVDAWLRARAGLPPRDEPRAYQWSLRLVQLAVALRVAGAVFHKLLHGHGTRRWALSDSLRHHLLVRFDLAGLDRPAVVDWIIDDVWKYRTAALLNMVTQLAPIFAVIFVRRPLVRAAAGLAVLIETIALGLVVALWNLHWLPLVAVFIYWYRLLRKETKGTLFHIAYPVEGDPSTKLIVATTRPETLLGDTAVAVHPEDERYKNLIGKRVKLPLTNRTIEIIGDTYVDKEFGTGVVKITPAHDFNDYQVGVRHKLEMINILNKNGTLNENAGKISGLKVQEARKQVLLALRESEFLVKEEPYTHSVGYCSRSGAVVEPFLSEQWFAHRMSKMATTARHVVENGSLTFEPESWTKVYLHWLSIIEDWCISRQLWWGNRIPAWTCEACGHVTVAEVDATACEKCHSPKISQDEDVLDTWFSPDSVFFSSDLSFLRRSLG